MRLGSASMWSVISFRVPRYRTNSGSSRGFSKYPRKLHHDGPLHHQGNSLEFEVTAVPCIIGPGYPTVERELER
jgi:hypothetical protein